MRIDFKTNLQGRLELDNGTILDSQILNFYDHDNLANGTGWVDLPQGLIDGKDHFKGVTDKQLPKMDGKGNVILVSVPAHGPVEYKTGNGGFVPDPNILTSDPSSTIASHGKWDTYSSDYIGQTLENWSDDMLSIFFNKIRAELIRRNEARYRMWWGNQTQPEDVMNLLGFNRRKHDRWYHPILGIDSEENWLKFEPGVDKVSQVATMLLKTGYVKGQFRVRMDIKTALDIR